jgi:RNase P protein component
VIVFIFQTALAIDLLTIFQDAAFNNLQNNDIGLISNNNLYKKIARYYDFYASAITELENKHDFANTYDEKFIYFKKHFKIVDKKMKLQLSAEDTWKQEFERYNFAIKNVDRIKKDEEFKLVLAESEFITSTKISFYQQLLEKIEELNYSIDSELETLQE